MSESEEEQTKVLNGGLIKRCISEFSRTTEGNSFAYLRLDLANRELENLCEELASYQQLKYLHLSGNRLNNAVLLSRLPNILRLELSNNRISSHESFNNEETFTCLQYLDLSHNLLRNFSSIKVPKLVHLNLSHNEIISTEYFQGHSNLKILELRGNKLSNLTGLKSMPRLEELYLCENSIAVFDALEELTSLKRLHLRKNNVSILDEEKMPDFPELLYLNLRENTLKDVAKTVGMKKYGKLQKIVVSENPCWTSQELVKEVLIFMPRLEEINKQHIGDVDREIAYELASERFKVAEAARKEAERKAQEAADKD
jgi:protein phosphatase 1 regulatory subunit 7